MEQIGTVLMQAPGSPQAALLLVQSLAPRLRSAAVSGLLLATRNTKRRGIFQGSKLAYLRFGRKSVSNWTQSPGEVRKKPGDFPQSLHTGAMLRERSGIFPTRTETVETSTHKKAPR